MKTPDLKLLPMEKIPGSVCAIVTWYDEPPQALVDAFEADTSSPLLPSAAGYMRRGPYRPGMEGRLRFKAGMPYYTSLVVDQDVATTIEAAFNAALEQAGLAT